jgi:hypothetical protein
LTDLKKFNFNFSVDVELLTYAELGLLLDSLTKAIEAYGGVVDLKLGAIYRDSSEKNEEW